MFLHLLNASSYTLSLLNTFRVEYNQSSESTKSPKPLPKNNMINLKAKLGFKSIILEYIGYATQTENDNAAKEWAELLNYLIVQCKSKK